MIPPPAGSAAPQGGFPTDLTGINLSDWVALVQDVAAGLQALLPSLNNSLGLQVVNLLQLVEAATGVGFCRFCCHLEPHCRCMGVSVGSPYIVELDFGADSRLWSDRRLWWSDHTKYLLGRYV